MKEEILVEQMKNGNKDAFDALYEKYKNIAIHTAYLITGNLADSEDVVQETFVKVYLHSTELKSNSGFKAWMMQILVRTAYRMGKKKSREFPDEETVNRMENGTEISSLEQVMQLEERRKLNAVIRELPIKQRTVVILFYYNECSVGEIAKLLGCMEGTVKSRLHTARKTMKKILEEEKENFV
ncbi:MAG: RNA polymerase sigma factor [Lachnospiraceae bacterium]|nr:RNA polymerase sigma factor [Lachnospiraceae bacterium]